mmetsp:Transcript_17029/g.36921  ORF Transcript_17029/g.36921 Transcript_17029/m.36921 type:complete len:205 (-) Transcript_17029:23-637(-)
MHARPTSSLDLAGEAVMQRPYGCCIKFGIGQQRFHLRRMNPSAYLAKSSRTGIGDTSRGKQGSHLFKDSIGFETRRRSLSDHVRHLVQFFASTDGLARLHKDGQRHGHNDIPATRHQCVPYPQSEGRRDRRHEQHHKPLWGKQRDFVPDGVEVSPQRWCLHTHDVLKHRNIDLDTRQGMAEVIRQELGHNGVEGVSGLRFVHNE